MNSKDKQNVKSKEEFCSSIGISVKEAEKILRSTCGGELLYFKSKGTPKERGIGQLIFAAISNSRAGKIKNILEMGTGDGTTTKIFTQLFPSTKIYTVDLPPEDIDYSQYALQYRGKLFNDNISSPNIISVQNNTFALTDTIYADNFDLIWVDGGHRFPSVAWDAHIAYRAAAPGALVLFHDYKPGEPDVVKVINYVNAIIKEEVYFVKDNVYEEHYIAYFTKE